MPMTPSTPLPPPEKKKGGRPRKSIVSAIKGDLVTIHIQFPSKDVEAIDRYATARRQNRSAVVRDMVIEHLMSKGFLEMPPEAIQPALTACTDKQIAEYEAEYQAAFKKYINTLSPEQQASFFKTYE